MAQVKNVLRTYILKYSSVNSLVVPGLGLGTITARAPGLIDQPTKEHRLHLGALMLQMGIEEGPITVKPGF